MTAAHAISATARRPAAPKAATSPTTEAIPPSTGPNRAPTIAAAIAEPIIWPRRAAGVSLISHVSPAVQAKALPTPCVNRATSRTTIESPSAKTKVVTATIPRPKIAVGRAPYRATASPPGIPPASAPSA